LITEADQGAIGVEGTNGDGAGGIDWQARVAPAT
jgi:hypothetical protein